jgi:hypothetical protein
LQQGPASDFIHCFEQAGLVSNLRPATINEKLDSREKTGIIRGHQQRRPEMTATLAPSAVRRLAIATPMPREPPVTSATLPASGLSWVLPALVISSLEFLVPFGTIKV